MLQLSPPARVAIIGAGIAGSACARRLQQAGHQPTLFDKSRGPGGRMATRRAEWVGSDGKAQVSSFDHGAQYFTARHPSFRALIERGTHEGWVAPWAPRIAGGRSKAHEQQRHVALPGMPEVARRLLGEAPLRLGAPVSALERLDNGWRLQAGEVAEVFDAVILALPAEQAAALVAPHRPDWADRARSAPMLPCWSLMLVTDEVDWPFEAAWPESGPLAWVARNDSKPGRTRLPGYAQWVAQASAAWSREYLEREASKIEATLTAALREVLGPAAASVSVHHASAHRWRYARPADDSPLVSREPWWDPSRSLGLCGDFLGGGRVEDAFLSGEALAASILGA